MWFSGEDVKKIAETLQVAPSTVYEDQDYIENHADDLMKNYIVKTIPHLINKSIYQIDIANREAIKVMKDPNADSKLKITAALAVAKTARDVIEIVAGNKGVVEKALELDQSLKGESIEDVILSGNSSEAEEPEQDSNRIF
jgi:hypothetical protein